MIELVASDIEVLFVGAPKQPLYMMERVDIIPDLISKEHVFEDFKTCLEWIKRR